MRILKSLALVAICCGSSIFAMSPELTQQALTAKRAGGDALCTFQKWVVTYTLSDPKTYPDYAESIERLFVRNGDAEDAIYIAASLLKGIKAKRVAMKKREIELMGKDETEEFNKFAKKVSENLNYYITRLDSKPVPSSED